jgi:prophage regulatory protein
MSDDGNTTAEQPKPLRFLRMAEVTGRVGLSRTRWYDLIAMGRAPKPVPIGLRATAWVESEIENWMAARIADRDARRQGAARAAQMEAA